MQEEREGRDEEREARRGREERRESREGTLSGVTLSGLTWRGVITSVGSWCERVYRG